MAKAMAVKSNSDDDGTIRMWSDDFKEEFTFFYGQNTVFSNFHSSKFLLKQITFQNVEQFFHYMKAYHFDDQLSMKRILEAKTPYEQKKLGRGVKNFNETKWREVCTIYMKDGNMAKYEQNEKLRKKLFGTVGTTLVEASPTDCKWGIGLAKDNPKALNRRNWRGSNLLGCVLMEVRDELMKLPQYHNEVKSMK